VRNQIGLWAAGAQTSRCSPQCTTAGLELFAGVAARSRRVAKLYEIAAALQERGGVLGQWIVTGFFRLVRSMPRRRSVLCAERRVQVVSFCPNCEAAPSPAVRA